MCLHDMAGWSFLSLANMVMGYQLMMFIHITTLRISLSQIFNTSIGRAAGDIMDARREKKQNSTFKRDNRNSPLNKMVMVIADIDIIIIHPLHCIYFYPRNGWFLSFSL